ncbi:MAG: bifunctional phosphoribosylaminoimidazolecarboxamide formyltransferase/IMP cyclohydrolase [Bacteroidota bacterium]|nr:bifunctional phosphoribosylaminoimidazolecarboxamide formyltransferase/IMP cyclohydrolase [Bacteroidota bacterium]
MYIKRALISVSNKEGIVELAAELQRFGVEIISTGGTHVLLSQHNIPVKQVSEVTGFPEILDGRVKTLHPAIYAGLLAVRDNPVHRKQLEELHAQPIDLVVVNLYPFERTISQNDVPLPEAIEQIDIGGPTMLRAAAKNYLFTAVVVNPQRYQTLLAELRERNGAISEETRFALAQEVFRHTAHYDAVIARYLTEKNEHRGDAFPETITVSHRKSFDLRYGENPHQRAALYGNFEDYLKKLHGKELSYNNILDATAAVRLVAEFDEPTVAIIKHTNPCGVGIGNSLEEAYVKAVATDSTSAFGGIIAANRPIEINAAQKMDALFTEIIIAPAFSNDALDFLMKKKNRRLLLQAETAPQNENDLRSVLGGVLVQSPDHQILSEETMRVVTQRQPTEEERRAAMFAWKVAKHVKSNAIVYAAHDRTLGIGAGQMSRVDSSRIAAEKARNAGLSLAGSVVASDAYFPFADGLLEAVRAGATAVIEPGGSVRDEEVIKAANDNNIAMIFTGIRHFRH